MKEPEAIDARHIPPASEAAAHLSVSNSGSGKPVDEADVIPLYLISEAADTKDTQPWGWT